MSHTSISSRLIDTTFKMKSQEQDIPSAPYLILHFYSALICRNELLTVFWGSQTQQTWPSLVSSATGSYFPCPCIWWATLEWGRTRWRKWLTLAWKTRAGTSLGVKRGGVENRWMSQPIFMESQGFVGRISSFHFVVFGSLIPSFSLNV